MSWDKTYTHTLALALDRAAAAVIFNEPDITISSLCWIALNKAPGLDDLKLYQWQYEALVRIGGGLEYFWPGHCAEAVQGDLGTSVRSQLLLRLA